MTTYKDGTATQSTYDINEHMLSHTDRNGKATNYEYDKDNNLTKVTDPLEMKQYTLTTRKVT